MQNIPTNVTPAHDTPAHDTWFHFPQIDEVAFALGPLEVRWYALAYIVGLLLGWLMMRREVKIGMSVMTKDQLDQLLNVSILGIIIGGRLGYVLFYNLPFYLNNPLDIFKVWQGGMSFHGGFLGVIMVTIFMARRIQKPIFALGDEVALVATIGLFFGRVANFINGELFGRVTDLPIGIVFPHGGPLPRHPSQIYEALLEGLLLFGFLLWLRRLKRTRKNPPRNLHGLVIFGFLLGYGISRFLVEFVREPDGHIGFVFGAFTMGQILSLPMILLGMGGMFMMLRRTKP